MWSTEARKHDYWWVWGAMELLNQAENNSQSSCEHQDAQQGHVSTCPLQTVEHCSRTSRLTLNCSGISMSAFVANMASMRCGVWA